MTVLESRQDAGTTLHLGSRLPMLNRLYDPLLRWTMSELRFKTRLGQLARIEDQHRVLDLGIGFSALFGVAVLNGVVMVSCDHDPENASSQTANNTLSNLNARTTSAVLIAATVTMSAPTTRPLLAAIPVPPSTAGANMSQIPSSTLNASVTGSVTPHAPARIWPASGGPGP